MITFGLDSFALSTLFRTLYLNLESIVRLGQLPSETCPKLHCTSLRHLETYINLMCHLNEAICALNARL